MPVPAARDIRTRDLDPLALTALQRDQLAGTACARCGSPDVTRPAGYAYVLSRSGRLGRPVKVCDNCPQGG
ncbi:hypothetical protein ACIQKB_37825 [Streptomyces sp. NPDC092046]|uniref:hypothetical protein n=1 Tax=Streptomyces sp. NPDC092046 TaxID=3366009 RepID=UPI0037F51C18